MRSGSLIVIAGLAAITTSLSGQNREPGFYDVWLRELTASELAPIADSYDRIADSTSAPMADRERAAYRAGWCYEVLQLPRLADRSYRWLAENGRDSRLEMRALRRIRALGVDTAAERAVVEPAPRGPPIEVPESVRDANMVDALRRLAAAAADRASSWSAAEREFDANDLQIAALVDLRAALAERGVTLRFTMPLAEEYPNGGAESAGVSHLIEMLERDIDNHLPRDSSRDELWAEVADRLYERSLARCRDGDIGGARSAMRLAGIASNRGGRIQNEFAIWLRSLRSERALAVLADQLEVELDRERRARLRRLLREAAERSDGRQDRLVLALDEVLVAVARAPESIRRDAELRVWIEVVEARYDFAAGSTGGDRFLERLRRWRDDAVGEHVDRLERWIAQRATIRSHEQSLGARNDPAARRIAHALARASDIERREIEARAPLSDTDRRRLELLGFQARFLGLWFAP